MNVESILAGLQKVSRSANGWMALCPGHADRNPSLSIREGNGKILVHCFAGCTVESICEVLGIRTADLFVGPRIWQMPKEPIVREAERQIAGLRSRLTPSDRERPVTVVMADAESLEAALARALALTVEGEIVQVVGRGL
jgi:hypothetical protein